MTTFFSSFQNLLKSWTNSHQKSSLKISGLNLEQITFALCSSTLQNSFTISVPSLDSGELLYRQLKANVETHQIILLPQYDEHLFDDSLSPEKNIIEFIDALSKINSEPIILILTPQSASYRYPAINFFQDNTMQLKVGDQLSPNDLAEFLVELGYFPSYTVEEPGSFSKKGEVFDLFPTNGHPIRIYFDFDEIEEIFLLDIKTNKSKKEFPITEKLISAGPQVLLRSELKNTLRTNIKVPPPSQKEKFLRRKDIFDQLNNNILFDGVANFFNQFFDETFSIYELTQGFHHIIVNIHEFEENLSGFEEALRVSYEASEQQTLLPSPDHLFHSADKVISYHANSLIMNEFNLSLEVESDEQIEYKLTPSRAFFNQALPVSTDQHETLVNKSNYIREFAEKNKVVICFQSEVSKKEITYLLKEDSNIEFKKFRLSEGFYYPNESLLVLSEQDFFGKKAHINRHQKTEQFNQDIFAEQMASLNVGDYVIHRDHGVGVYLGLESQLTNGDENDYIVIEYDKQDKVYLPSYKINLIQKYASKETKKSIANLRTKSFDSKKSKIKNSIKTLAFNLLELQAKRETAKAFAYSPNSHLYNEFALSFPFDETPDQLSAINNVHQDMEKTKPMDHLVCGDVGFGKTEVAIRAAYKAVLDHKQVVVLVPTTILALQHFNSFQKRLKNTAVNIELISRFKKPKEVADAKLKIAAGAVDIIIGTHKVLSDSFSYQDLGLVIVDEEQRFGVNHKEKLKTLKSSVDFLTLSATPIPRTMQMAFLGLKEFSLIKTPPPKRQSIKTYVVKDDDYILKQAIERELHRGGQVFIVHNRVKDIQEVYQRFMELVPEARITFAHGQMNEKELEQKILDFYQAKYNVLIATTIIESGIDIPNANTLIVSNADKFGLSQLHQLRGRIGRSDRKAYAYLCVKDVYNMSTIASKRLKALQSYSDIGSGFSLASCDLEIRGAGDILGAEQSGHLDQIGLELYMDLLKEAIEELKGNESKPRKDVEISPHFSINIPQKYISNQAIRLKNYKRLANCKSEDGLLFVSEELTDAFGPLPESVLNLISVFKVKIIARELGVVSIKTSLKTIEMAFDQKFLVENPSVSDKIIQLFTTMPRRYQFAANGTLTYHAKNEVNSTMFHEYISSIAQDIKPC